MEDSNQPSIEIEFKLSDISHPSEESYEPSRTLQAYIPTDRFFEGQYESCQTQLESQSHVSSTIDTSAILVFPINKIETFQNDDQSVEVHINSPEQASRSSPQMHHPESIKEQKRPEIGKSPAHNTCPICFEPLTADPSLLCSTTRRSASAVIAALREPASTLSFSSAMTPCGHLFHASCIIEAMEHSFTSLRPPRCPLCREALERSRWAAAFSARGSGAGWQVLVKAARGTRRGSEPSRETMSRQQLLSLLGCCVLLTLIFTGLLAFYIYR